MHKKVVFLPYDFDSAIGINNEGALVFGYSLEDTDHTQSGAEVYNGQQSVLWNNLRKAFPKELQAMYQNLRSTGVLSYGRIEKAFEDHQGLWGEAIFNEDMQFKCIDPLVNDGDGTYLEMMQGSKAEQRKWWLYNRFRYIDSKYNAGDALSDIIQLRGYAKANITVTPYADIYPTVKYGSYLVQTRGVRNQQYTLVCPVDTLNDTEIYIYSASQLASVGDLSGLKVGLADFSRATKIQSIKLGDSSAGYDNGNLKTLYLGNNVLLRTLDVRNCSGLGNYDMKAPDISGCFNIEYVYFEGTNITGLTLPNGGILKVLHLPGTITNLTIRNQTAITDFTIPSYSGISTLWLDNVSSAVNSKAILNAIATASRVRLIGIAWEATDAAEIIALFDKLDNMRGLDEYGNNMDTAQISGTIHTYSLSGEESAAIGNRLANYPYLRVTADHTTATLTLKTWDGSATVGTVTYVNGVAQSALPSVPTRSQTAQYTYTAVGWATTTDAQTATSGCTDNITVDKTVYAAYSRTVRTYTATFVRGTSDGGGTLYTQADVPYGTTPTYGGETPTTTREGLSFTGWQPTLSGITGDTTYTAVFSDTRPSYGVEWHFDQPSPALTRTELAAAFADPVPATMNSGSGTSPFDTVMPWAGMKRYNIIDNAIAYSEDDAGFSETLYDTLVYIPEFWYKTTYDATNSIMSWSVSPEAKTGYTKHPGSGRYVGRFHSSMPGSVTESKSGATPKASMTIGDFRTASHNKGTGWWQLDLATWSAIQMLYLIEYANFDSQLMLGKGQISGSVVATGATTGAAYHTIKREGADGNMYRWIENPFTNVMTTMDGIVAAYSYYNAHITTDTSLYGGSYTSMTNSNIAWASASGFITAVGYSSICDWAFIPTDATDGSDSTYVTDYFTKKGSSTQVGVARIGGPESTNTGAGMFLLNVSGTTTYTSAALGSRLIYIPTT